MANEKLFIAEYAQVAVDSRDRTVLCGQEPPIAEQVVDYSAGVAASTAFNASTKFIRVHTNAICSVLIGTTPVAGITNKRMVAGQTEFMGVDASKNGGIAGGGGTPMKISAIINT